MATTMPASPVRSKAISGSEQVQGEQVLLRQEVVALVPGRELADRQLAVPRRVGEPELVLDRRRRGRRSRGAEREAPARRRAGRAGRVSPVPAAVPAPRARGGHRSFARGAARRLLSLGMGRMAANESARCKCSCQLGAAMKIALREQLQQLNRAGNRDFCRPASKKSVRVTGYGTFLSPFSSNLSKIRYHMVWGVVYFRG